MKRTRWADRAVSAAVLAAALAVGGCAAPAVLAPRAGCVRLEQLVKLHPDYDRLSALEGWVRAERAAARQVPPAVPPPTAHAFFPIRGGELRPPDVAATLARVQRVTGEELRRLEVSLTARAQAEIARRAREAERQARAEIAQQRLEILRELESARRQVLLDQRPRVANLRLQVTNLEQQVNLPQLLPEEKARAQARLQDAGQALAAALREQADRLDELQRQYGAQLAALDQAAAEQVSREVAQVRERLMQEVEAGITAQRTRLTAPLAQAAREITLGLELPEVEPAVVAAGELASAAAPTAAPQRGQWEAWSASMNQGAQELLRLRDELAAAIERDTRVTAQTLAQGHRWRLVWSRPTRGGVKDITAPAQNWLRGYWGASAEEAQNVSRGG